MSYSIEIFPSPPSFVAANSTVRSYTAKYLLYAMLSRVVSPRKRLVGVSGVRGFVMSSSKVPFVAFVSDADADVPSRDALWYRVLLFRRGGGPIARRLPLGVCDDESTTTSEEGTNNGTIILSTKEDPPRVSTMATGRNIYYSRAATRGTTAPFGEDKHDFASRPFFVLLV